MKRLYRINTFLPKQIPGADYLILAAAVALFGLIVGGSVLQAMTAGGACPDWFWITPCLTGSTFAVTDLGLIDALHRLAAAGTTMLVFIAAGYVWLRHGALKWARVPMLMASGLVLIQSAVGAGIFSGIQTGGFRYGERAWMSALHLGLSLLALAATFTATSVVFYVRFNPGWNGRLLFRSAFSRLAVFSLLAVIFIFISGAAITVSGSQAACPSWPFCSGVILPVDPPGWINFTHRASVALAGLLIVILCIQAWRTQRTKVAVLVAFTASAVLFFSQALLGAKLTAGLPVYMVVLHQATAVASLATLLVGTLVTGIETRPPEDERLEISQTPNRQGLVKDLIMLTKPVVVLLLLVTTYAGMVIGGKAWPDGWLAFWTLLAGFMAAGGSGAINQFIDRNDDGKMQRTQKRPIPAGRLTPAEGLAFGVAMTLASFFILVAFVNLLAALLSLAGIFYYVFIYSIFLKKTTVQNIVIGGGAGAIPPLVGWAAVTGSLNIPSLFLFAVVFMWTPPHFWALALVRRNDYARAGVPMLPVVRGEKETRRQILVYTFELVALTLFLPLFGLGGSIYLLGAIALGLWLISAAWKVWKQEGNKVAWKMYRYSSMYLAFLFLVLMIDALM
jgi:protoheme IX farnesyltransferase